MFNVYYTDRAWPDSEFVDRVWYDNTKSDLYVELHGAIYQYRNVPETVFNALITADSAGRYYTYNIKGKYNPGSRLGSVSDLREMRALPNVQDVTKAEVRTSQGYAPVVSLRNQSLPATPTLSLVKDVPTTVKSEERRYDFVFTIESDDTATERKHSLTASSEDEALDKLFDLGYLLDQDILPVSSTVYYD